MAPTFGHLLRQHRKAAGLTQEELAERACVSVRSIQAFEAGARQTPRAATIDLLATALVLPPPERTAFTAAACRRPLLVSDSSVDGSTPASACAGVPLPSQARELGARERGPERSGDWSEAPDPGHFYGREAELATLERWLVADRCRLVAVAGMGGVGKTALVARLTEQVGAHFDVLIWRSLLDAPPLTDVMRSWLQILSAGHDAQLPPGLDEQFALLLDHLRRQRCLLVLDNLESILRGNDRAGSYRSGYEDYGRLLRVIGQSRHQGCLLLTGRERPLALERLEGQAALVRSLCLAGLQQEAAQAILEERNLVGPVEHRAALVDRYSGNPLALRPVAAAIRDLFAGDIAAFLRAQTPIFDDLRDILEQQFTRLSPLEHEVLVWLAIEREAVSLQTLQGNLIYAESTGAVLEAVRSLQRRSLLETCGDRIGLPHVLTTYVTGRLIAQVCREVEDVAPDLLNRHALVKAQAGEDIRQSQVRFILQPIAQRLASRLGPAGVEAAFRRILDTLHVEAPRRPGYAARNILALLLHLGYEVQGYDFARLSVWQAYVRGAALPAAYFAKADLAGSVLTEAVRAVHS
jgi:transcriptional regulator with XRE-family HTH domain